MPLNSATHLATPAPSSAVEDARQQALIGNLQSEFAREVMPKFRCPACRTPFQTHGDSWVCEEGHTLPVRRGVPDLTRFSETALDEKEQQARFHDDEENNESFEEIVLRPYNYNAVHAESWLYHLRHFQQVLKPRLGLDLKGASILNCGCGGGFEAAYFAEAGARVVGFDISQLRAEASATRFALKGLPGFFYRGDASILPFDDGAFDLVIYHDSLHHVPIEEIPPAIREAARVARRGVALLEPHDGPIRLLLEALGKSASVEESGNYVFRFNRRLLEFWARQTGTELAEYSVRFTRKEHRPRLYGKPIIGRVAYGLVRGAGVLLNRVGNEACILLKKPA